MAEQEFALLVSPDGQYARKPETASEDVDLRFRGWREQGTDTSAGNGNGNGKSTRKRTSK